jgi:hypothetical protein
MHNRRAVGPAAIDNWKEPYAGRRELNPQWHPRLSLDACNVAFAVENHFGSLDCISTNALWRSDTVEAVFV